MADRAGGEIRLQLGIDGEGVQVLVGAHVGAIHVARRDIAVAVYRTIERMHIGIAQVLPHGKGVIELMGEAVAHHLLAAGDFIIGLAFVEIGRQLVRLTVGVVIRHHGAFARQPAVVARIRVILEVAQEGEVGFIVRTPAKGGRHRVASRFRHLLLGILTAAKAGQAIRPNAGIINGVAKVKPGLPQIVGAHLKLHFFQRLGSRALADHADDTARVAVAVQHRGWPAHHFHALEEVRIHGDFRVVIPLQLHAVQILVGVDGRRGGEAANGDHVIGGRTAASREDAWRIGERLFYRRRLAHLHLLARHHRHRLRRFFNRGIGFGRRGGAFCRNSRRRSPGAFLGGRGGNDGDSFFLLRLFCCLCVDRHAANRRGYYSCDFTQRVIWLSSFWTRHGYISDESE